ncbi:MAG: alpha-amylase family glycosyl hydrolase [Candidatus Hodarchaeales archaeon]
MEKINNWWKKSVFYQIYPRSYNSSTNTGIGDLQGIIQRLPYLKNLGIDALWVSPFYPSPQEDFGYDITNFIDINPEYGSMKDFDELLQSVKDLGLKLILDMVLNHTSHRHKWFVESKSDKNNSKREWYVWRKGCGSKGDKPPNNWKSIIGGSAWEWDEETKEFYLHQFLPCQPDLNWRNPKVQKIMFEALKFWLDKGVDGYRLDIIHTVYEDKEYRNNPTSRHMFPSHKRLDFLFQNPLYTQFLPETIDLCYKLRKLARGYSPERVLIGEAAGGPHIFYPLYGDDNHEGLNLVFDFQFTDQPFSAKRFQNVISISQKTLGKKWPCYTFSNHDTKRMISRYGNNESKAKLLTLLLLTLRCTPFIYQGEEIGMRQVDIPKKSSRDPIRNLKIWGIPVGRFYSRDGCRTPMQWDNSQNNAGFSPDNMTIPWLPISPNVSSNNVRTQIDDKKSMLSFYRRLIKLRKESRCLQEGAMSPILLIEKDCLCYSRTFDGQNLGIFLNFSKKEKFFLNPYSKDAQLLFSTNNSIQDQGNTNISETLSFQKYEGIILHY